MAQQDLQMATCSSPESYVSSPLHWFAGIAPTTVNHPETGNEKAFNGKASDLEEFLPPAIGAVVANIDTPFGMFRTIIGVNSNTTMIFSGCINDEFHEIIVWLNSPYLTDKHGKIYFPAKNGVDIWQSLTLEIIVA